MEYDAIAEMHQFRTEIDAVIKKAELHKGLLGVDGQREIALVRTKLQEAKMWAGKVLEELKSPFPEELRDEAK